MMTRAEALMVFDLNCRGRVGCLIFIVEGGGVGVFDWNYWGEGVVREGSEWE